MDTTTEPEKPLYDLEQIYDEKISPLITQIIAICKEHRLPMLATFQYRRDEEGAGLCTTSLPFHEDRGFDPKVLKAYQVLKGQSRVSMMKTTLVKGDGSQEVTFIANLDGDG